MYAVLEYLFEQHAALAEHCLALYKVLTTGLNICRGCPQSAEQVCSAVQAVSEDECGLAAMSTDKGLQQLLVQLMDDRISLLFRGRAASMLAGLDSGSVDIFAEVSLLFCSSRQSMPASHNAGV